MATTIPDSSAASSAGAQQKTDTDSKSLIAPDFNMFLKLLTTQMQNQDPLNPMDTSEYTQQLVQFSQVEQSMQQTSTLKDMLARMSTQDMAQSASYIGQEGRFDSATSGLADGKPATWSYAFDTKPAAVTATVKDSSGAVVKKVDLTPDTQGRFSWDGIKTNGDRAADGGYTLSIAATDANNNAVKTTINSVGTVKEVVTDGANVMLSVNGLRFPLASLVAVSAPAAAQQAGD
ncbi:flagellar hook assembly protein FlgD [Sphingomonas quercus]|uniref:Basal-body rod modification protein FlgD n=1 Tax=Sphingomonas quercus TaxID=2842451 RepID=A0ABS6BLG0_9SPHN|nr:flagellar hook capping FlgD N-terminal domain-containing protein [Sphingomonas quercus]MBU3078672.1 flagellar hook assembly protein FlgD [Sphingomonas quercus]